MKWKRSPAKKWGVLCGAEKTQEWLLPWWWARYREHNTMEVSFCDFGMSEKMQRWCADRGEVIPILCDSSFIAEREAVDSDLASYWESFYGPSIWNSRKTWFKKPFAFLESPYERGLWVDLDCEILGALEPLFTQCDSTAQIALVREYPTDHLPPSDSGVRYNGGLIVFEHGAQIVEKWAEGAVSDNHRFWGDDPLLSYLISLHKVSVVELPDVYNWRLMSGVNLNALVVHWVGSSKAYVRKYGGFKPIIASFHALCQGRPLEDLVDGLPRGDAEQFFGNL